MFPTLANVFSHPTLQIEIAQQERATCPWTETVGRQGYVGEVYNTNERLYEAQLVTWS